MRNRMELKLAVLKSKLAENIKAYGLDQYKDKMDLDNLVERTMVLEGQIKLLEELLKEE